MSAAGISNRDIVRFVELRIDAFNTDLRKIRDDLITLFRSRVSDPGQQMDFQLEQEYGQFLGRILEIGSLFDHLGKPRLEESDGSSRFYDAFLERFASELSEGDSMRIRSLFGKMSKGIDLYVNFLTGSDAYIKAGYKGPHPVGALLIEKAERVSRLVEKESVPDKLNKCLEQSQKFMEQGVLSEIQFNEVADFIRMLLDQKPVKSPYDSDPEPEPDHILDTMQTVVEGLTGLSEEGFFQVFEPLSRLSELKSTLRTREGEDKEVAGRIYFHLHRIHLKERKEIIDPQNSEWGLFAFQNEVFATELERLRAAQRTYVEFLISRIKEAMDHRDSSTESILWDRLGMIGSKLSSLDVPPGVIVINTPKTLASLNRLQQRLLNHWTAEQREGI